MRQILKVRDLPGVPQVGQRGDVAVFQKVGEVVGQDAVVHVVANLRAGGRKQPSGEGASHEEETHQLGPMLPAARQLRTRSRSSGPATQGPWELSRASGWEEEMSGSFPRRTGEDPGGPGGGKPTQLPPRGFL